MSGDSGTYAADPKAKPIALAIAFGAVVLAAALPVLFAQLPKELRPWNLQIIGALGIFAAARLGFWQGIAFTGLAICGKDLSNYFVNNFPPSYLSWPYFIGYAAIGWLFARRSRSPVQIGGTALTGSLLFFFTSNFAAWYSLRELYARSFAGLMESYVAAIPFFRGTLVGDLAFTGFLFGAHAVLSRAYTQSEQPIAITQEERA